MLRKKTNGVARRSQRTGLLSDVAEKSVDRRSFLRGSGLAIGGLAAISATGGTVTPATAQSAANTAVDLANRTRYGLAAGAFTRDIGRALRVAKRIRSGIAWITNP